MMRDQPRNLRSLDARIRNLAQARDLDGGRVRRQLAARIAAEFLNRAREPDGDNLFLVKGGTAVELRLGIERSRSSRDLDTAFRGDLTTAHQIIRETLARPVGLFTGRLTDPVPIVGPGLHPPPQRMQLKLSYAGSAFGTVPIEVAAAELVDDTGPELIRFAEIGIDDLNELGLPPLGEIPCLPLSIQLAQKLHACTEPWSPPDVNNRARDLVAILLLWPLAEPSQHNAIAATCQRLFNERGRHAWPLTVEALSGWDRIYEAALRDVLEPGDLPGSVTVAAGLVQDAVTRLASLNH